MQCLRAAPQGGLHILVKAVPGASRDEIAGVLGERLKVRVSAAPEGGKANRAIAELLAAALGLKPRDVELVAGPASAEKTFQASGVTLEEAARLLGAALG
ncbi:MAG: DUF167 family protein [Planctomycetota bacterium]|nr:DUF167 family protein [Planctomycetota bacterium]